MIKDSSPSSFSTGKSAQERALSYVPDCYVIPDSRRPSLNSVVANVHLIDLTDLKLANSHRRSIVIHQIQNACRRTGFFQVVNHGIEQSVLDGALSSGFDFFRLPAPEKTKFQSNDIYKPVRYGTSFKDGVDKVQFWRLFLKHYAHPLDHWINSWPSNPPLYREKMGKYCLEARKLALELMEAVTESLGLGRTYLSTKFESGMQVTAVNCYPPCPDPSMALGLPSHTDYSCLTILLMSSPGLQIMDFEDGTWKVAPHIHGALQIFVGDHLEVLSNSFYKSVIHRAILNTESTRISIASLHSLEMDENMVTANELVDQHHPKKYKGSSVKDFLNFLAANDLSQGKESFIDTLKI